MDSDTIQHPSWCARGHRCSAVRGGEHLSDPVSMDGPAGRIVVTRTRTRAGADRIEVRASIDLPPGQDARQAAAEAVTRVARATSATGWRWNG